MKKLLTVVVVATIAITMNAQILPMETEIYKVDGEVAMFDVNQPARSVSEEDAVISMGKCIRWLFMSDFYAMQSREIDKRTMNVQDTHYSLKSAIYAKMYKKHNCSEDDFYRYKIMKDMWYIGLDKELFTN